MKALILFFIITLNFIYNDNEKLVGLWKSVEENIDYINVRPNGDYIKINNKETQKLKYVLKEKYIQIEEKNGNFKEEAYYIEGDTLVFQSIRNGKIIKKKYLRQKLAL
jgi:hypothetical protein